MKQLLLCLFLAIVFQTSFAQVTGIIANQDHHAIPFATITLWRSPDSALVKSSLSNDSGAFKITDIPAGQYFLRVSAMGYQPYHSENFEWAAGNRQKDLGAIALQRTGKLLSGVSIRADKPLVQQEAGGMIVNVQSSILTMGSSVLDVLQRSPGVTLDQRTNSLSLNGKPGVMVLIDGKLLRMPAEQLTTLLSGMSADNIEKIELLNTAPVKYDADGNAGLISIVIRKNKKQGTNGSVTATAGYGRYEKGSASISIDHNAGRVNLHGSYSYSLDHSYREFYAAGGENVSVVGGQIAFNYLGIRRPDPQYQVITLGMEVQAGAGTTLGYSLDYSLGRDHNNSYNYGTYALRPDSVLTFKSKLYNGSDPQNMIHSLYLDKAFGKGDKLHVELDYLRYHFTGNTTVESSFEDNHGNAAGGSDSLYAPQQRDLSNTIINVAVVRADYNRSLGKSIRLESGLKATSSKTSAVSGIQNFENGQWVNSSVGTTNNLVTGEVIGAAYGTLDFRIDSLTILTAGARYEYSHNTTDKTANAVYVVDRRLGKLFPGVFFSRKVSGHAEWQASYTSRITRPSYGDLASYITYDDPVSVFTGNPTLKSTITHNIKLGYNDRGYSCSLLFSRDDNPILYGQLATGPTKGLVYVMPENGAWQNNLTLQVDIPFHIGTWWEMRYELNCGWRQYRVDYTPVSFEKAYLGCLANFSETFKPVKGVSIELSGSYNSLSYYSNSMNYAKAIINAGIKKELPENQGSIQLSISDIFSAGSYGSHIGSLTKDAFNSDVHVIYNTESACRPIFRLSYFRSFGLASKSNKTNTDVREEQRRIGN